MRLNKKFFKRTALEVAPDLLGKFVVRKYPSGKISKYIITETECYLGEKDLASHASKGKTSRTKIMYEDGGFAYTYLIYGMYWMLGIVTGKKDSPEIAFIRCLEDFNGPGKVGRVLKIDKTFYGEDLTRSKRIWVEDNPELTRFKVRKGKRVGVNYAGGKWADKLWRFILTGKAKKQAKIGKNGLKTV